VVVEPSIAAISEFKARYSGEEKAADIRFIVGDFNNFPVDYYAADLIICIDNLNFIESGSAIDEFSGPCSLTAFFILPRRCSVRMTRTASWMTT
jgi:hypothetical protein